MPGGRKEAEAVIELTLTVVNEDGDVVPGKKIVVRAKSIDMLMDGKVVVKGRVYSVIETMEEMRRKIQEAHIKK